MDEPAYAKINLALHVRERRPDGYHSIETLFAFADQGDRLKVAESDRIELRTEGPFAAALSEDNLVVRAAEAMRERFAIRRGAALTLEKRLPVASGIGGGSADAAATMRLLARWWALEPKPNELLDVAKGLGADVPACVASVTAIGTGKGDELEPVDAANLTGMPLLLVNPRVEVATGEIFRGWDCVDRGPLPGGPPLEAALAGRNDLESPATVIAPQIHAVLASLRESAGATLARMSGSGATCFALFGQEQDREAAAARIAAEQPGWWLLSARLR